ncbi:MAG TPA: hypothetical protein VFV71_00670 [Burkholderiales bacterium]|nr:hypothetical protein [Burkholderiales bacterium]
MAATVVATGLAASRHKRRREAGFRVFLASYVLWVIWGRHDKARALIALQVALAALNIRGAQERARFAGVRSTAYFSSRRHEEHEGARRRAKAKIQRTEYVEG